MDVGREFHHAQVEQLAARRDALPFSSHVRAAITDDLLNQLRGKIESTSNVADLNYGKWPMVFGFVESTEDNAIRELDDDIDLVLAATAPTRRSSVTSFLNTRETDHPSRWYGGLFELWAKATLLRHAVAVQFDVALPNGRNRDIVAQIGRRFMSECALLRFVARLCGKATGRKFNFECTVITEDDESRAVWDRFIEDKKNGATGSLMRPGPYDPPDAKGPSPYCMPLRLYGKFFDKLTKDLDPARGQCADDQPNIILVCFAGCGVSSQEHGVNWAIEELLADHPKMPHKGVAEGRRDISLQHWADFTANNLVSKNKMSVEWYCDHSNEVISAPRRLGGAILFDGTAFARARINYNAREQNSISHAEMAELERLFSRPRRYWH